MIYTVRGTDSVEEWAALLELEVGLEELEE